MNNSLTPQEAAALIESETGEALGSRRLLYMARRGLAGFPQPVADVHPKLIRFDRDSLLAWARLHFPDSKKHRERAPDSRPLTVAARLRSAARKRESARRAAR
jgi:hypothetical protein